MSPIKAALVGIVLMRGSLQLADAQCASVLTNIGPDGSGNVHAWAVLTDNYTNLSSGCAPSGWVTQGFTHTYNASVTITSPSGRKSTSTGSGSLRGGSGTGSLRVDDYLPVAGEVGNFLASGEETITCSFAGLFFPGIVTGVFTPPPPTITGVGDNTTGKNIIYVDTSGYLAVYGSALIAWGETPTPTVTGDDSAIPLSLYWASDAQVNVHYSVGTGARTGQHSLWITTEAGKSNAGTYYVGDATPVISSITPSTFAAGGVYTGVTISGSHFGTACPTVSISGAGNSTFSPTAGTCLDTSVQGTVTIDWAATGPSATVTLASNGYGNGFQSGGQGQSNQTQTTVTVLPIKMKLQQQGQTVISTGGRYSEDTTIQVTAVRADTGATIPTFVGTVNIAEDPNSQNGSLLIYTQNGGSLPSSVSISSGGTATFVAKSLAGPKSTGSSGAPPANALIKTTNYGIYGGADLSIVQWIISGTRIDSHSSGQVYDWFQARSRDIFNSATGDVRTVLAAVSSYSIAAMSGAGLANWQRAPQSPIVLNPYFLGSRLDAPGGPACGSTDSKWFTNTLLHEARHAYHGSQAAVAGNDKDGDFLLNSISVAPTTIVLDTTLSRTVCNESTGATLSLAYHGDSVFDQPNTPDYASYAWEMDAWVFAGNHDH